MKKKAIWAAKRFFRQLPKRVKQVIQRALAAYRNVPMKKSSRLLCVCRF